MTSSKATAVYVSADIEGCATLVHWDEVMPGSSAAYERARRLLVAEVNAALAGAFAGGAQAACVNDAHSRMRNLVTDGLDQRARLVTGRGKPGYMLEGIDAQANALAFFVGYHGAIGDRDAVMGHTYSPRVIWECRLGGRPVGELTINAALAGAYGVPVALVSGDRTTCEEAKASVPWAQCVETKQSVGYYAAVCLSPHEVQEALRQSAQAAFAQSAQMQLFTLPKPIALEIDTLKTSQADAIARLPGFTRPAERTVAFSADDMREVYRALVNLIPVGASAES
ncbi:MAG TPA: M55 family metallopeptidase [Candidatus Acidoferrales bacterium]|nr:M55 family metallopeptidase [Candidatus Acidoferrales bacterium]